MPLLRVSAAACAFLLATLAAPSDAATTDRCARASSKTVALSGSVRVLRRAGRTFACHRSKGRLVALGDAPEQVTLTRSLSGPIRIVGDKVAYGLVNAGAREKLVSIVVLDARTSKKIKNVPAFERIGDPQEGRARVTDIELRSNGAVGWIAFNNQAPAAGWEVRRADRRGSYLLAAGPSIAPTSLALSGTRLYWTDSGKAFGDTLL